MKKALVVVVLVLIVLSLVLFAYREELFPSLGRSKSFGALAGLEGSTALHLTGQDGERLRLFKTEVGWQIERSEGGKRVSYPMAAEMQQRLETILRQGLYFDLKREAGGAGLEYLGEQPLSVQFWSGAESARPLLSLRLGLCERESESEERCWVEPSEGGYWRIFSPGSDLSALFRSPARAWLARSVFEPKAALRRLSFETPREKYSLYHLAEAGKRFEESWRLQIERCEDCTEAFLRPESSEGSPDFELDSVVMASLLGLLKPLYAEDLWSIEEAWGQLQGAQTTAVLELEDTEGQRYRLDIGPELSEQILAERGLSRGARFARWQGEGAKESVFILGLESLQWLFPSPTMLRTKFLWRAESQQLSRIEVLNAGRLYRYQGEALPSGEGFVWRGQLFGDEAGETLIERFEIDERHLARAVKAMMAPKVELWTDRWASQAIEGALAAEPVHPILVLKLYLNGEPLPRYQAYFGEELEAEGLKLRQIWRQDGLEGLIRTAYVDLMTESLKVGD